MFYIAIKMLMGDTSKYIGIIFGITFATLIMSEQPAIFWGLMSRTFSLISDMNYPSIWVMDPQVQRVDDFKPMQDTRILNVRGVEGVRWAVPLYKGNVNLRLPSGGFQSCVLIGLDDATLIGAPGNMIEGNIANLRQSDGVIIDNDGAAKFLRKALPNGGSTPIGVGDTVEINDLRAIVVGVAQITRVFQSQPVIFTTYSRALLYAPKQRLNLAYILVGVKDGYSPDVIAQRISNSTGLLALTSDNFKEATLNFYFKNTGIPINFGIAVALGFLVGATVSGLMFFNFTHDNIRQFGALKAMGANNKTLVKMIMAQALLVGFTGWGLGTGLTTIFGYYMKGGVLAFQFNWYIMLLSAAGVLLIVILAAIISIYKVVKLEPAIVFKS